MNFRYIALYGLRFSEEEIIAFVKLFHELMIIPNLKSSFIETFALLFTNLLEYVIINQKQNKILFYHCFSVKKSSYKLFINLFRKKENISPKKLQLKWRPLFELCEKVIVNQNKVFALHKYSSTTENALHSVALSAKVYFPVSKLIENLTENVYPKENITWYFRL